MECESSGLVLLFYPVNCLSPGATGYYQAVSREGGGYSCVYPMSSRVEADCERSGGLSAALPPPKTPTGQSVPGSPQGGRGRGWGGDSPFTAARLGGLGQERWEVAGRSPRLLPQLLGCRASALDLHSRERLQHCASQGLSVPNQMSCVHARIELSESQDVFVGILCNVAQQAEKKQGLLSVEMY